MEFTFLGTSSGAPTKTRNVSALALGAQNSKQWFLVDCGEGTQHQLLQTPYSLNQLAAVFITHVHGDHCYGLPGLLASAALHGRQQALPIIAPAGVAGLVQGVCENTQLHLGFDLEFIDVAALQQAWVGNGFSVSPYALSHRVPSYAYGFTETDIERRLLTDKLVGAGVPAGPLWGAIQRGEDIRLDDGGLLKSDAFLQAARTPRCIIVGGDNDNPALLAQACHHADVLIHEATYTEDVLARVGPGPGHSSAARVAQFAESVELPQLLLTHFSARYQDNTEVSPSIADIEHEAKTHYTGQLWLARDFDRFVLNRDKELALVL